MSMTGREMAGAGGQDAGFVKEAFAKIADRYVLTNHVLSVGADILWRKKVGRLVAGWQPKRILDVATGTGDLALEMQKVCPQAEVVASDFCEEMLAHATRRGVGKTLVADGTNLPFDDQEFDVVTVAFGLRNMADWEKGVRELARVGRRVLVLDFSTPRGVLEKPYCFYLNKVLPKIAGAMTGQGKAYEYLAGSIEKFPTGPQMLELLEVCGLSETKWIPLSGGIASIYTGKSNSHP